ncbi:MAG: TolC family protein [Candidatus Zixiibacteriota bacterium]
MNKKLFFIFLILFSSIFAEDTLKFTLDEAIEIAKTSSPKVILARHRFRRSYWEFRRYKSHYVPHLSLSGEIPSYNRSISKVTRADGTDVFVEQENASSSLNLSLSQNIGFTGGELYLSSEILRNDVFGDSTITSYLASPVYIGLNQPLFSYNNYKWDKEIEPLKFKEARMNYVEELEQLSIDATNHFFNLLSAQINLKIAEINSNGNDTLFKIAQGRYNLGTIAENELLQMELALLNSNVEVEDARVELQTKLFELKSFLGIKSDVEIELTAPAYIQDIVVEYEDALEKALENNTQAIGFERREIVAERNVCRSKSENSLSINLYASYGLTKTAPEIPDAYQDPGDRQQARLGFEIPIVDGGFAKGNIRMAESSRDLELNSIEQERTDFAQDVFLKVRKFNMQKSQVAIAAKADTVAKKRYEVARQRYLIGKITITELNNAQTDKDSASKAYIEALRTYWVNFYNIRKLTHFDYVLGKPIYFENFMDK